MMADGKILDDLELGRAAYEAYRKFSKGKSLVSGQAIPSFEELPLKIKAAWVAAALTVKKRLGVSD